MFVESRYRRLRTLALLAATSLLLSGCALIEGPTPQTPDRATPELPADPEFYPDGSAEDNWPYFTHVLTEFSEGDAAVNGEQVVNAIVASGFDPAAMQVSFDRTETDLAADNIFVSVRFGDDCLIGQVVVEAREIASDVMPAVGASTDICLLGSTREIDWV